jgi:hypothetical protein
MQVTPRGAEHKGFDASQYIASLRAAQNEADFKRIQKQLESCSPLELYEAAGLIGGWHTEIPRGIVRFALESWSSSKKLNVRQANIYMLVTGFVLFYKFQERNRQPRIEDPHIIKTVDFDDTEGDVEDVVLEYKTEEVNPITNKPTWIRMHYWQRDVPGADPQYFLTQVRYDDGAQEEEIERKSVTDELPYWPYVAVRWIDPEGIIAPVKAPILRYETTCLNIASDNDKHSHRKTVYEGVSEVETGANDDIEILPMGATTYYRDTHPQGLDPMFREQDKLEERIRHTVGYIRVEKLHNISGVARLLELRPMLSVAVSVREKTREMFRRVYGDATTVFFPALIPVDSQDREVEYRNLKEMLSDGVVTEDEFMQMSRLLRDLPPLSEKEMRALREKREADRELRQAVAHVQELALRKNTVSQDEEDDDDRTDV